MTASALVTGGESVSVTAFPLIVTFEIECVVVPALTENAVASGAAPKRLSSNMIVSVDASTDADTTLGATVSAVAFTAATGPKVAVSFFAGAALSRILSAAVDGCEYRTVTVCELFGGEPRSSVTVEPNREMPVGAAWATPSYAIVNAPAGVVAVPSRGSLMVIASWVPATFVAAETNAGGVTSGICTTFAEPKVLGLPTLSVTTAW